uniref:MFS transporter n=1 Tax=Bosea sp. NBC_00436 TaxID=2969620 RepID=A0A9E8CUA3_9HYPH
MLRNKQRRAIIATVTGNGLEWFDFTVYSYFSITLSKVFFPTGNDLSSLLLAVATFGVGFVMRPVGGIILGIYADKVGRKSALTLTIAMMAVGTLLIAVTPSYESIGIAAPCIIVFARLLQGFSAGGEMGTAGAFLTEHAPERRRCYFASWILSSIGVAILLGAASGAAVTLALDATTVELWGWRLPFLFGSLIGPVGYYLRKHLDETPVFAARSKADRSPPLFSLLSRHFKEIAAGFSLSVLWTVAVYVLLFYMPTYAAFALHRPQSEGFVAGIVGGLAMACAAPLAGILADRYGSRTVLLLSAFLILVLAWPMFKYINLVPGIASLTIFQILFGALTGAYTGPILGTFARLFPSDVLSTSVSVAYNFAVTIFGGFASFFVTWLIAQTGSNMAPALYVMAAAAISLLGVAMIRSPKGWKRGWAQDAAAASGCCQ